MIKRQVLILIKSSIFFLFVFDAQAIPVQWGTGTNSNGHWYDILFVSRTWDQARLEAETLSYNGNSGHLATVTSAEENSFIVNNLLTGLSGRGYWLGGYQSPGQTATDEGWQWVTGETWDYTNWWLGNVVAEPNDWPGMGVEDGQEDYMGYSHEAFGEWNDTKINEPVMRYGYIIEYEGPASVPEPSAFLLFSLSLIGLIIRRRNAMKLS